MCIKTKIGDFVDKSMPKKYYLRAYPAKQKKRKPFAIICPGGGYEWVCSYGEGKPIAKALNQLGYTAFVLRYHCKKRIQEVNPQEDIARAVRYIIKNADKYHVKTEGYSVWGFSAGGHLAASYGSKALGYRKYGLPKPAAIILSYPVITMGKYRHIESRDNLLGKNPSEAEIKLASIELQVDNEYPPTFIWNSRMDDCVKPINSEMMAESLKRAGIEYKYIEMEQGEHGCGLGIGTPCEGWFQEAVNFWEHMGA